jgi:hypothetical protein
MNNFSGDRIGYMNKTLIMRYSYKHFMAEILIGNKS